MYTFGQLAVGDLFNTKSARWVKTSSCQAMSVMSGCFSPGETCRMTATQEVIVLWSSDREINPGSQRASLSESEKEDRFYRKIEAEIDAENRKREAAEFRQSLIAECDALEARRYGLLKYIATLDQDSAEYRLANKQAELIVQYALVLCRRLALLDHPALQTV